MTKSILITVCDGFGGWGDLLFALKLAAQVKKYSAELLIDSPPLDVKIITPYDGKIKIKTLKGDVEYGLEILTLDELKVQVDNGMEIASIIEGPVFQSGFMSDINYVLANHAPVPLIMMPEYSESNLEARKAIEHQRKFRRGLTHLSYQGTIYTGLNSRAMERGILLSDNLRYPDEPSVLQNQLEERIKSALMGTVDIDTYQAQTDLYFQYSHDTYLSGKTSAAIRFLKIQRIYAKASNKSQDVLMVGRIESSKFFALYTVKQQLIKDGFTKISFYNVDAEREIFLLGDSFLEGKHYRVIYTPGMTHSSMTAAQALSADLMGATGDQSFSEGVSADKVLVYECLDHKKLLHDEYYKQLETIDPTCAEVLMLLKSAHKESHFKRLEVLLTEEMKVKLKRLSEQFQSSGELAQYAAIVAMPMDLLIQVIKNGRVSPFMVDSNEMFLFERIFRAGQFDVLPYIIENHLSDRSAREQFCQFLVSTFDKGKSFIQCLSEAKPNEPSTSRARYLAAKFHLAKYKTLPGSKREVMVKAFIDLISTFNSLGKGHHDEDALIGLMLLTTKNISNEYTFMSPEKGMFFGSRFYSNIDNALKTLGVNLKTISLEERQRYHLALAKCMKNNPQLVANNYILKSLSKEAHITLPKIPPLLKVREARELLTSDVDRSDQTVFHTGSGMYKRHPMPLGQGGWGRVYAARHYSFQEDQVSISPPLAIKEMPFANRAVMEKEMLQFQKAYPEAHFERFDKNGQSYLAMPLFPGIQLDDYLDENLNLNRETRLEMAASLLENLQLIHSAGITHNDLKPMNILYDPISKKMHIVDFGCAENTGTPMKYKNFDSSVFAFEMPPEYMDNSRANPKMDIFSLTPVIAQLLGANKKEFVRSRMERALAKINNPHLASTLRQAFEKSETLEVALFSKTVYPLTKTNQFESFVRHYVNEKYDFSPYQDILGEDILELLNNIQNANPNDRSGIEEALAIIKPHQAEHRREI